MVVQIQKSATEKEIKEAFEKIKKQKKAFQI